MSRLFTWNVYFPNFWIVWLTVFDKTENCIPKHKNELFKRSLQYSGAIIWNDIPLQIRTASTLQTYKSNLFRHIVSKRWLKLLVHTYVCVLKCVCIVLCVRGLSVKFVDTANKSRIVYHRLMKFCINKYQLSGTMKTQYVSLFLNIDWFFSH